MTRLEKIDSLLECYHDARAAESDLREHGMTQQADECEQTALLALSQAEELGYVFSDEFDPWA